MEVLAQPPSKVAMNINGANSMAWLDWFHGLYKRMSRSVKIPAYTKAALTTANGLAPNQNADGTFTSLIYVTDATGGATLAFSNGTDWISTITGSAV